MNTETYHLSDHIHDGMIDHPWHAIIGKRAVFTTFDGDRITGTIEPPNRASSDYPIIRFDNGQWGRCDDEIELVVEG